MQRNILWTGRAYYSLENCLVQINETGSTIISTIIGSYEDKIYKVAYRIETNRNWETVLLDVQCQHDNKTQEYKLQGDGLGNWMYNGKKADHFEGCIDVDVSLTPFTNTLPIRRLNLRENQAQEIRVLYCNLLNEEIKPVNQKYTCLSNCRFHYQNIPNDFEAILEVDESGLVVDYPFLFVMTKSVKANYSELEITETRP